MIQIVSAALWLLIALTGFVRILHAFDSYHEDVRTIQMGTEPGSEKRVRYLANARNQRFRYVIRVCTVVNAFLLGTFSLVEGVRILSGVRNPIETLVFLVYYLVSVFSDLVVINVLTEHDLWSRDVADGAYSGTFGRWLLTVTPKGILRGLGELPGRLVRGRP